MQTFFGALNIRGLDSFLDPQHGLLLLSGFPDDGQAARAATNFIVNVRRLPNGAQVVVTGTLRPVGSIRAIEMSDINAAGTLARHFTATAEFRKEYGEAQPEHQAAFRKRAAGRPARKRASKAGKNPGRGRQ